MTRLILACLLLCGCRIENDKSAVPSATTWAVDDTSRTPSGARSFSLTREGAFAVQPGHSAVRPRIALACTTGNPIVVSLDLPRKFLPATTGDSGSVVVRWRTNEASPMHTESWHVAGSPGDSLASVHSDSAMASQIRSARTLTLTFLHAPQPEELSFELTGLSNYLTQAAATCGLDPATLLP